MATTDRIVGRLSANKRRAVLNALEPNTPVQVEHSWTRQLDAGRTMSGRVVGLAEHSSGGSEHLVLRRGRGLTAIPVAHVLRVRRINAGTMQLGEVLAGPPLE